MPFKPHRLLIAFDPAGGLCGAIVPRMKELLEERAFLVDVHELGGEPADIGPYRGIVLGAPVPGLGVRRTGPTERVAAFVRGADGIDEKKVALFCVHRARPGDTLTRMRALVEEQGAEVVVEQEYWRWWPDRAEHVLPAECMIRIR